MNDKDKKLIRLIVLSAFILAAIALSILLEIESYFLYIISTVFVFQGVKVIVDFTLGLAMRIGYVGPIKAIEKNLRLRIAMLLIALALIVFGTWMIHSSVLVKEFGIR